MKNTNYIINGVLALAVIILFILQFTGKKNVESPVTMAAGDSTFTRLPIAYVNSDSLIANYNFAKDLNEALMRKNESLRATVNQKGSQFQKEYMEYQQKASNNAFLSRERMQEEEARLRRKQQELEEYTEQISKEFSTEQAKMNQQLSDSIIANVKIFNQQKKYQIIFSTMSTSSILLANDAYNITGDLIQFLNNKYTPAGK